MEDEELRQEGWRETSVSGGEHLRRILKMYEELGIETYLEEISPEEYGGCTECYRASGETIYKIYTRQEG
jgi:protein-arginine kinase activator protein McsA